MHKLKPDVDVSNPDLKLRLALEKCRKNKPDNVITDYSKCIIALVSGYKRPSYSLKFPATIPEHCQHCQSITSDNNYFPRVGDIAYDNFFEIETTILLGDLKNYIEKITLIIGKQKLITVSNPDDFIIYQKDYLSNTLFVGSIPTSYPIPLYCIQYMHVHMEITFKDNSKDDIKIVGMESKFMLLDEYERRLIADNGNPKEILGGKGIIFGKDKNMLCLSGLVGENNNVICGESVIPEIYIYSDNLSNLPVAEVIEDLNKLAEN